MVVAAWRGGASKQQGHFFLPDQPDVRSEDTQEAAHTQTLDTLPPGAQASPYCREGRTRC